LGRRVAEAVRRAPGVFLSVSTDAELALELGASGLHVQSPAMVAAARGRFGGGWLIGMSAHTAADVEAAARAGADYVTLSPIFATASKPGYGPALGPQAISAAGVAGIPVLALGGVNASNAGSCL